ncbi:helix-turn-helix domain-containing protein, partial [Cesiribacter sp. SM1]|uniref:helix-turn-helix domain-containing protein n=1 Tax=Cesiribacter sp. SM1 TaxID=2861196 RepID=UPI00351D60C7
QRSRKLTHPLAQARVRAFYLYKINQNKEYGEIAKEVGYGPHAVGQWFKLYREKGLQACLSINAGGHKRESAITGKVLQELKAKLSDPVNYFTSYKAIHQWLEKEHDIHLSYEHVHKFVHQHLGAKLKVVRKSNLKKDAAYEEKRSAAAV